MSFLFPYQQKFRWFLNSLATSLDKIFRSLINNTTAAAGYYIFAIK
jgi:hypothetical protein